MYKILKFFWHKSSYMSNNIEGFELGTYWCEIS
jgi:hypothetical protein